MNLYQYEIFAAVKMKLGRNTWCLDSGRNDMFCLINNFYMTDPKAYRLETSLPRSKICSHLHGNSTNSDRYKNFSSLSSNRAKSDWSDFIVTPDSCKRIGRNVWRLIQTHASLRLSWSHVNTPLYLNARLAWLTDCATPSSFLNLV